VIAPFNRGPSRCSRSTGRAHLPGSSGASPPASWRCALLGAVKRFIARAELRALDPELASLRNLNRPEDLSPDDA
jgi:hypothetical protein